QLARAFVHPQPDFARAVGWGRLSCISRADNTGREFYPRIQNHELLVFLRCRSLILGIERPLALAASQVWNTHASQHSAVYRVWRKRARASQHDTRHTSLRQNLPNWRATPPFYDLRVGEDSFRLLKESERDIRQIGIGIAVDNIKNHITARIDR